MSASHAHTGVPISIDCGGHSHRNCLRCRSSFGEYNPGGGKEQVRKYLLLCKEQVEASKISLETIIQLLKI